MGLSKADATDQMIDTITKAGVEVTSHINSVLKLYRLKPVGSVTRMVFNVVHDHFICNIARCGAKISSPPKSFTPIPSA